MWRLHRDRLLGSAERLGIPLEASDLPDEDEASRFVRLTGGGDAVLRLNVGATRSGAGRCVWMIRRALPPVLESARLALNVFPREGGRLACVKSFNYLERRMAYCDAKRRGFDDAVLATDAGGVLETAHSNVFARVRGEWRTPPADGGLLPGTVRQVLLSAEAGVVEAAVSIEDLRNAEEAVITNSVQGVVPVGEFEGRRYARTDEGRRLQQLVSAASL